MYTTMYLSFLFEKQIKRLRDQLQKIQSPKKTQIIVHDDIDKQDTMLMTVESLIDFQRCLQQTECPNCKTIRSRITLERKRSQFVMSYICESCYDKSEWTNSNDCTQPGINRKFVESMTVSGINY